MRYSSRRSSGGMPETSSSIGFDATAQVVQELIQIEVVRVLSIANRAFPPLQNSVRGKEAEVLELEDSLVLLVLMKRMRGASGQPFGVLLKGRRQHHRTLDLKACATCPGPCVERSPGVFDGLGVPRDKLLAHSPASSELHL